MGGVILAVLCCAVRLVVSTSLEVAMQPSGCQEGWQLVSSATAAGVVPPAGPEADVEFGAFLGAGSYGRCVVDTVGNS